MLDETERLMRVLPDGKLISALGFGCSSIWAKSDFPIERALNMLELAVAEGINHFDTGPSYADGEARLGAFLKGRNLSSLVISTKVGTEFGDNRRSFDPTRMRDSFASSLRRMNVPAVDILYLHGPALENLTPEVFDFFATLKEQGLIRYSGVNSFDPAVVAACITSPVDAVMLQYSISDRRFDKIIKDLSAAGKIVIAGTVLAQGIFTAKTFIPRDRNSLWYMLRAIKNDPFFIIKGRKLAKRLARTGLDPYEAALRFAVSNPDVTSSLFGTSKPSNLASNARAGRKSLSEAHIRMLMAGKHEAT